MGYFESRRPSWSFESDEGPQRQGELYKADGKDDDECCFHERMKGRRYAEPEAGFGEVNIVYPFIDRHLKTSQWTRQDDGSFVFSINRRNAVISFDEGEVLASRWDGVQIYVDSVHALEQFLL